eukprot:2888245-Karenia_brevis.AAC.1
MTLFHKLSNLPSIVSEFAAQLCGDVRRPDRSRKMDFGRSLLAAFEALSEGKEGVPPADDGPMAG